MLICKDNVSYKCSNLKTSMLGETHNIKFSIVEPITPMEVSRLFTDDTFYFYDDVLGGRFIETNNKKLVGLNIKYNDDSTCDILIKLK